MNDLIKENAILKNQLKQFKNDNNKLREQNNNLMDEQKEKDLLINELKDKIKKLNMKPLDYTKWKEWDTEQVYKFIMNIYDDNTLDEYKDDIYKEIFESEYTGDDLDGLELNDIKSFGIKKIKIRKKVYYAIKQLTQNSYNNNQKSTNFEGNDGDAPTAYI